MICLPGIIKNALVTEKNKGLNQALSDFGMENSTMLLQQIHNLLREILGQFRITLSDLTHEGDQFTKLFGILVRLQAKDG